MRAPRGSALAAIGIGVLGLAGGTLAGIVVQDVLATLLARIDPTLVHPVTPGLIVPVCASAGAALALGLLAARRRARRSGAWMRG